MNDLLCGGFALVIILAALVIYRRSFSQGYWDYEHKPQYFDRSNPADVWEYRAIEEQRRSGRERGGEIITAQKRKSPHQGNCQKSDSRLD